MRNIYAGLLTIGIFIFAVSVPLVTAYLDYINFGGFV